jgi:hypothetical protein
MTQPSKTEHRVVINEGTVKKNLNPPPVGIRPPPPKAQVAPATTTSKKPGA